MRFAMLGIVASVCAYAQALTEIKTIFVGSFGKADGADIIREKVINRLAKSQRVKIVTVPDKADAILIGAGEVTRGWRHSTSSDGNASGGTTYDATLAVRLISKDDEILWVDEAKPTRLFLLTPSVSSSVADKVSKNLLKALDGGAKRKK